MATIICHGKPKRGKYKVVRAVQKIIVEQYSSLDVEELTQLGLFMVAVKLGKF